MRLTHHHQQHHGRRPYPHPKSPNGNRLYYSLLLQEHPSSWNFLPTILIVVVKICILVATLSMVGRLHRVTSMTLAMGCTTRTTTTTGGRLHRGWVLLGHPHGPEKDSLVVVARTSREPTTTKRTRTFSGIGSSNDPTVLRMGGCEYHGMLTCRDGSSSSSCTSS